MILKGRLKTDFLFSDDLFYWYFKWTEDKGRPRFTTIISDLARVRMGFCFFVFIVDCKVFRDGFPYAREWKKRGKYIVLFELIGWLRKSRQKNAHIVWDMRQVYKGEIEEKNQAASSNSTGIIMYERHRFVNFLYAKILYFLRKRQIAAQLVLCNTLVFLKISYKSMSKLCVV